MHSFSRIILECFLTFHLAFLEKSAAIYDMGNLQSRVKNFMDTKWTADEEYKRDNVIHSIRQGRRVDPARRLSKPKRLEIRKKRQAKIAATTNGAQATQDTDPLPFRFLDLPQELRDNIYRYYLQDANTFYLVEKGCFVPPHSSLHSVCHEICEQISAVVTSVALLNMKTVVCTVFDFDFKTAVEALEWLESSKKAFSSAEEKPTLMMQLCVSEEWTYKSCLHSLAYEWYPFVYQNSKQGLRINIDYVFGSIDNAKRNDYDSLFAWRGISNPRHEMLRQSLSFVAWDDLQTELWLRDMRPYANVRIGSTEHDCLRDFDRVLNSRN